MLATSASVDEYALRGQTPRGSHAQRVAYTAPRGPHRAGVTRAPHYGDVRRWRPAVRAWITASGRRSDWQHSRLEVARVLADNARTDGTSSPTWDWIAEETGLARRTVARALVDLERAGWLTVVETGSTELTRPSWSSLEGNRAAVYGLLVLEPAGSGTPLRTPFGSSPNPRARWRPDGREKAASGGGSPEGAPWNPHTVTRSRRDELAAARALQDRVLPLRRLTDRAVRSLIRPWLRDGWTVTDIVWALDHDADGRQRWWDTTVTRPAGWLTHRLAEHHGTQPRSRQLAAARARLAAEHERQLAAWVEATAAAVEPTDVPAYMTARAALARLPRRRHR